MSDLWKKVGALWNEQSWKIFENTCYFECYNARKEKLQQDIKNMNQQLEHLQRHNSQMEQMVALMKIQCEQSVKDEKLFNKAEQAMKDLLAHKEEEVSELEKSLRLEAAKRTKETDALIADFKRSLPGWEELQGEQVRLKKAKIEEKLLQRQWQDAKEKEAVAGKIHDQIRTREIVQFAGRAATLKVKEELGRMEALGTELMNEYRATIKKLEEKRRVGSLSLNLDLKQFELPRIQTVSAKPSPARSLRLANQSIIDQNERDRIKKRILEGNSRLLKQQSNRHSFVKPKESPIRRPQPKEPLTPQTKTVLVQQNVLLQTPHKRKLSEAGLVADTSSDKMSQDKAVNPEMLLIEDNFQLFKKPANAKLEVIEKEKNFAPLLQTSLDGRSHSSAPKPYAENVNVVLQGRSSQPVYKTSNVAKEQSFEKSGGIDLDYKPTREEKSQEGSFQAETTMENPFSTSNGDGNFKMSFDFKPMEERWDMNAGNDASMSRDNIFGHSAGFSPPRPDLDDFDAPGGNGQDNTFTFKW